MSKLSTNLKELIQKHGITVSELARQSKLHQPVVHRLTHGKTINPRIDTLVPIADYFDITLDELVGR